MPAPAANAASRTISFESDYGFRPTPELLSHLTVDNQPLSSWQKHDGAHVVTRLAHELCQAAVYQSFGSEVAARDAAVPAAFVEGACSVVAGQADERLPLATVLKHAPRDPFTRAYFAIDPDLAYSAAFHAMSWVATTRAASATFFGDVVVRAAADGKPGCVERAFAAASGVDLHGLWAVFVDTLGTAT